MTRRLLTILSASIPICLLAQPDLIIHGGKIVTVDENFSIADAMSIRAGRIEAIGSREDVLRLKAPNTELMDLKGGMVLPGLIDSHTHPGGAAMTEFDHPIPDMETIADVLAYFLNALKSSPKDNGSISSKSSSLACASNAIPPAPSSTKPRPGIRPFSGPDRTRP